jgi:hypothetical protein
MDRGRLPKGTPLVLGGRRRGAELIDEINLTGVGVEQLRTVVEGMKTKQCEDVRSVRLVHIRVPDLLFRSLLDCVPRHLNQITLMSCELSAEGLMVLGEFMRAPNHVRNINLE